MTDHTPPSDMPPDRDALDALLDRAQYRTPAGLDVEGALRRVHGRMGEANVRPLGVRRETARPSATLWKIASFAAAAAFVATVGISVLRDRSHRAAVDAAPRVLTTAAGRRDSIDLADGTHVVLGPASEVTVGDSYASGARELRLRGIAHFDVRHDATRPFTVRTGDAVITDLGTVFDVHGGDDGVAVAVASGSVKLAGESGADGVVLRAGDRALRAASVALLRDELENWYGLHVVVADSSLAGRHVTASFSNESPKEVLDVITLALGARYETRGDTVVMHRTTRR
jgi:ferric-dicitrate binding protein FerR (iron transport regulator)